MNQKILDAVIKFLVSFFAKDEPKVEVQIPIDPPKEPVQEAKPEQPKAPEAPKFKIVHKRFCADGIFGELYKNGQFFCYTLEHSYDNKPKLVDGNYKCVRGPHRLHGMTEDFITFEIKGVPDFDGKPVTGVLFHWGNYNKDSEGCVLLGSSENATMVGGSRNEWAAFMKELEGFDTFDLEVVSEK
jgi:hypothetical protein